jgi:hypothetical protein
MLWVQFKNTDQRTTAKQIIQDVNNFIVNGWKVARRIPKWIHGYDAWINFMDEKCSHNNNEEYNSKEDVNNDENKDFEYEEDDEGKHDEEVEKIEEVLEDEDMSEEEKEGDEVEKEGSDEDEEEEEEKKKSSIVFKGGDLTKKP